MELSEFSGKPCQSRTAFEFVPKKKQQLDLGEVAKKLKQNGVYVEVETPFLLMLKLTSSNISLFRSGKIIVKETKDEAVARKTAEELIRKMK